MILLCRKFGDIFLSVLLVVGLTNSAMAGGSSMFIKAKTAVDVQKHLENLPCETVVFVDVDDTIITPVSKTFHSAPYNKLIDEIKKNKERYPNFQEIVSNWRLQRKVMLLDDEWPRVLESLKEKFPVYGLTKMDAGTFGSIPSMEEWRYSELKSLGIQFSENTVFQEKNDAEKAEKGPSFFKGIFITGACSKGDTLERHVISLKGRTIVMIDDRKEHLEDIARFCERYNLQFIGILFCGLENFQEKQDPHVFELQKKTLLEQSAWLEDEDAEAKLKLKKSA